MDFPVGSAPLGRKVNNHRRCGEWGKRMEDVRERFQNLHEFLKVARFKLNRNNWDYIVGGTETETTLARNRQSLDRSPSSRACCATCSTSIAPPNCSAAKYVCRC